MWFRRLSLFGFGILLLSHALVLIIVCGFFTLPPILFCFLPLFLPSLSGMEEWLHYFRLFPGFLPQSGTACACNAAIESWLLLDAIPAPRCNIEHWDSRSSTLLSGWFSQKCPGKPQERKLQNKQYQLGIITIHPSHAYQHGSSWGAQNDALPAWAGSQVIMSLESLWPMTQELR